MVWLSDKTLSIVEVCRHVMLHNISSVQTKQILYVKSKELVLNKIHKSSSIWFSDGSLKVTGIEGKFVNKIV